MSSEIGKPKTIVSVNICPDCDKRYLFVYDDGIVHCNYCGMGGLIIADKYRKFNHSSDEKNSKSGGKL